MAEWYEYGSANTTPHIHAYSGGDCHLKVAGGDRYDLIKGHFKVPQAKLNEAFDRIRLDYPNNHDTGTAIIAKMRSLLQNVRPHPAKLPV